MIETTDQRCFGKKNSLLNGQLCLTGGILHENLSKQLNESTNRKKSEHSMSPLKRLLPIIIS
jgi:hypothetical protein